MKGNLKRFSALLLATAGLSMSLAACGSTSSSTNTATSTTGTTGGTTATGGTSMVFSWWGNQVRNNLTSDVIDLYMEQNEGVSIDGQFSEWNDYWQKLATSAAGNSLPDILQMDYAYINQYVTSDLLLDLTPYIEDGTLDVSGIDQGVLDSGSLNGGIYAICAGVNAPSLLYNKTLLEENGIEIHDNMSMDDFISISREVYEKTGYKTEVAYYNADGVLNYWLRASGLNLYGDGKLGYDNADDALFFFELYETGLSEGWMCDPSIFTERSIGTVEEYPLVLGSSPESRSWCAFNFSNQMASFVNAASDCEIGITTYPSDNPTASNYLKPSQFFSVSAQSSNPEEAVKFLNWLTNSEDCNNILLGERGVPPVESIAAIVEPQLDEVSQEVFSYVNNVATPNSSTISPPDPDNASEVKNALNQIQERLCYGQITAAEACEEFFNTANEILAA